MRIVILLFMLVLSMAVQATDVAESQPTDHPLTYNLVFASEFDQRGRYGIFYIDNTRTEPYPLWLPQPYDSVGTPIACSPDGTRLIAAPFGVELQMMNLLTGEITVLPLPRQNYGTAQWSPTRNQVAFDNGRDVFVLDLDTYELTQVSSLDGSNQFPAWSPDGNQIAFTNFNNSLFAIYAKDLRTAFSEYFLTGNPDVPYGSLNWLQNDDQIVFDLYNPTSDISAVSVYDSSVTTILGDPQHFHGGSVWSPDETHFAFTSTLAGDFLEMFVARRDGTQTTRLTFDGIFNNEAACWLANPLSLPVPATPTFTPTSTFTPTPTRTPTATPIPLPPADTNLLTNPSFASGLAPWQRLRG